MHDWTSRDAKINSDYPQTPNIAVDYDLYSLDYTENFIKNKLQEIQNRGAPDCAHQQRCQILYGHILASPIVKELQRTLLLRLIQIIMQRLKVKALLR